LEQVVIHFTNGSIVVDLLAASGLPGRFVACADPLHDGPCVAGLDLPEWRELRARFLSSGDEVFLDDARADLARRDAAIAASRDEDEVVLWFEHDLFDQLNLIWLLDALARCGVPRDRVSLIVIGEYAGIARFNGLGQLTPNDLRGLFPGRSSLSSEALGEARAAWADVCATDPRALARRSAAPSRAWAWLPGALLRLVEELPGVRGGLSRTERQGLTAIAQGAATLGEAFRGCAAREERVFLGDWSFYGAIRRLQAAVTPPVDIEHVPSDDPSAQRLAPVRLTTFGRRVLAGHADHASVNGLDRWVGGVRLTGTRPEWRWDGAAREVRQYV
jgi:hypothetical protein